MGPRRTQKVSIRRDWQLNKHGCWTLLLGEYGNSIRVTQHQPGGTFARTIHLPGGRKSQASLHTSDRKEAKARAEDLYRALVGVANGYNDVRAVTGHNDPDVETHDDGLVTLGKIWELYRKDECFADNCEKTRKEQTARAVTVLAGFGKNTIAANLTLNNAKRYMSKRRAGCQWNETHVTGPVGPRSVEADLQLLRAMLHWATHERDLVTGGWLLEGYPLRGLKMPKEKNPRRVATTYERFERTREACQRLTACAYKEQGRRKWLRVELAILLAEATGRRIGAIAGLRWADISLGDSPVRITWRPEFDKDAMLRETRVSDELADEIRAFWTRLQAESDEWLFPNQLGDAPWSNDLFDQALRRAEEEASLPSLDGTLWHAYRRKWVTERKAAGWSLVDIAAVGGWKSIKVLEDCYALEDEVTMQRVMDEPTKLYGPITGVVKNRGKIATPGDSSLRKRATITDVVQVNVA